MSTNAIDQMIRSGAADRIDQAAIDDWMAADGALAALLFTGRAKRRPEGHDVAVALRELARQYGPSFRVGVVADEDEDALMRRFGVILLPSVVYFVGGAPIEKMPRIRDWSDYADAARRYLGAPPSRSAA